LTEFEQSGLDPRAPSSTANASFQVLKWGSLVLLVMQNSSLFVVTRYTRAGNHRGHLYLPSVVVLIVELLKMAICLGLILFGTGSVNGMASKLRRHVWEARSETLRLGVPAACYALQNNLIFVAISNLSATAAQVLFQLKTISTACFTILLLGKSFRGPQWLSFILLTAGVVLVQSEDAKSSAAAKANPFLGVCAALVAATLSGFAGVYLEKMFTSGGISLWMRNVQLGLFAIPLQLLAIVQMDLDKVLRFGLLQGFHKSTWLVVAIQVAGSLLTAIVIKHAGNVLKTFAAVLALLMTCGLSMLLFDFHPTALFWAGLLTVSTSIWLYARPDDYLTLLALPPATRLALSLALLLTCASSVLLLDVHPTPYFWAGSLLMAASIWLYARPDDCPTLWTCFNDAPPRMAQRRRSGQRSGELRTAPAEMMTMLNHEANGNGHGNGKRGNGVTCHA
jgi:UDP-sugar transporter A1/2/3